MTRHKAHFFVSFAESDPLPQSHEILPAEALFYEKKELDQKARRQKRQVQDDLQKRHVFVDQIKVVPG